MIVGKLTRGAITREARTDTVRTTRITMPGGKRVAKLSARMDGLGPAGSGTAKAHAVIYDASGNLLGVGPEVLVPAGAPEAWVDLPLSTAGLPLATSTVDYDVGVAFGGDDHVLRVFGDDPGSGTLTGSRPLTMAGSEITDTLRALATSGDGRGYKPITNLVPNGGAEVNLTSITTAGFGPGSAGLTQRITTDSKFGIACVDFNVTTYATGNSWAFVFYSGLPIFQAGQVYTLSAWVKLVSGTNQWSWHIGDTTSTNLVKLMTPMSPLKQGVWQKVTQTFIAQQSGVAPGVFINPTTPGAPGVGRILIDGVQVEVGHESHDYVNTQNNAPQTQVQRMQKRNHHSNPDFEIDATGWTSWSGPSTPVISSAQVFEGLQSLKATNGGAGANEYGVSFDRQPVAGGTTYTLSGYVYSTVARSFNIVVRNKDGNTATIGIDVFTGNLAVPANTWTRLSFTFTTPINGFYVATVFKALAAGAGEVFYLDAVQLEVGSTATAYMTVPTLVALDKTTGIYAGATNLINGDFETNITGWSNGSSPGTLVTVTRDVNASKFGIASFRGNGIPAQALTSTGTPITDASRALNVDGDGRSYQYVYNACPNGSFETNSTGWSAFNTGSTILRDSTHAKVGTQGLKITTPGTTVGGGGEGCTGPATAVGSATVGQVWTASVWVWSAAGGEQVVWGLDERDSAGSFLLAAISNYTLNPGWNRLVNTRVLQSASVSRVGSYLRTQGVAQAITVWIDSVQYEIGGVSHDTVETTTVAAGAIQGPLLTNYCTNGDFEYAITGWSNLGTGTIARSTAQFQYGIASGAITVSAVNDGAFFSTTNLRQDKTYVASAWFKGTVGRSYSLTLTGNATGTTRGGPTVIVATGNWQRLTVTGSPAGADIGLNIVCRAVAAGADTFFVDGVQLEEDAVAGLNVTTSAAITFGGSIATVISSALSVTGIAIPADSSYGMHEGTTNLVLNGGVETNLANIGGAGVVNPAGAPTVAINAVAGLLNGAYTYKITFVNARGETNGGTTSATVNPATQKVNLTAIPLGGVGVTSRKIYRTAAGGVDGTQKLVATIADNTTTTFTDNVADGSLGAAVPTGNTAVTVDIVRAVAAARFGVASVQVKTDGSVAAEGASFQSASGLARAAGTSHTASVWVKGTPGVVMAIWSRVVNTDTTLLDGTHATITLNGDWQRVVVPTLAVAVGKTGDAYVLFVRTNVQTQTTFEMDGGQIEEKLYATPYVNTSTVAVSRTAPRLSASYSSFLNSTAGSITFRLRYGFPSTELATRVSGGGGTNIRILDWTTDANNRLILSLDGPSGNWGLFRSSGGVGATVSVNAGAFKLGDYVQIVARWDSGNVFLSVNGSVSSAANTSTPTLPATVDFGQVAGAGGFFDGDLLFAVLGYTTVPAGDVTALQALVTEPTPGLLPGAAPISTVSSSSAISALLPFATTTFFDFRDSFPNVRTLPFAATAGTSYAFSCWVMTQPGQTVTVRVVRADFTTLIASQIQTATGGWQRFEMAGVAPATESIYAFCVIGGLTNGGSVWVDGAQLEVGLWPTPFHPTTRAAARVQASSKLLSVVQGAVAMRLRMGYPSTVTLAASNRFFALGDSSSERIMGLISPTGQFQIFTTHAGTPAQANTAAQVFAEGDGKTVIIAWSATTLYVSIDGGPFTSIARTNGVPVIAASLFDIGGNFDNTLKMNSDVRWFATLTDVPSDADAATINAFGDTPPVFSSVPAQPTAVWSADSPNYLVTITGKIVLDTYSDGTATPLDPAFTPLDEDLSIFASLFTDWEPSDIVDDTYRARLPFLEAQDALQAEGITASARQTAIVGWHGTSIDQERGSFVTVPLVGKFAGIKGKRVRISTRDGISPRIVYAYCNAVSDDIPDDEDLSVTRALYTKLSLLSSRLTEVEVEVLS